MAEEITAAVQQPEPAAPAEPAAKETTPPAEPTAKEPEATPAEPAKNEEKPAAAAEASKPAVSSAAAGEDEAAKKTAEKIANLEGKVHALSVGAKPEAVGVFLSAAPIARVFRVVSAQCFFRFKKNFYSALAFFIRLCYNNAVINNGVIDFGGGNNGK